MQARVIQGFFPAGTARVLPLLLQPVPPNPVMPRAGAPPPVQRFAANPATHIDPTRLGLVGGGGQALPQPVRETMQKAFAADFSGVRVHVGPQAERLGALAFTVGSDIYFAPGRYQPDSIAGRQLLGHELAHVVQQRQGRVRPPASGGVSIVHDHALEAEADRLAQRAALFAAPTPAVPRGAPAVPRGGSGFVQRKPFAPPSPVLQPKGGAKALAKLAQPKVFPGPEIPAQTAIVDALEQKVEQKAYPLQDEKPKAVICLGAVELPADLDTDKNNLIANSRMIRLPDVKITGSNPQGTGTVSNFFPDSSVDQHFELVNGDQNLQTNIKTLVIGTMIAAGQIEYLKTVDWAQQNVRILVEVHYYRQRNPEQQAFHKDTLGQTLFVNLNFVSEDEIVGPEYVINPAPVEKHEQQIAESLPPGFHKHLLKVRKGLGEPAEVGATKIAPNGAVSFVDELVHHKTPTYGHRQVSGSDLGAYLKSKFPDDYKRAEDRAWYRSWYLGAIPFVRLGAVWGYWGTNAYNDEVKWDEWLSLAADQNKKYDRPFLRTKRFPDNLIDSILAEDIRFRFVSIPSTQRSANTGKPLSGHSGPTIPKNKPPLTRRMSTLALNNQLPPLSTKPRRFFRTWVRAVPV